MYSSLSGSTFPPHTHGPNRCTHRQYFPRKAPRGSRPRSRLSLLVNIIISLLISLVVRATTTIVFRCSRATMDLFKE